MFVVKVKNAQDAGAIGVLDRQQRFARRARHVRRRSRASPFRLSDLARRRQRDQGAARAATGVTLRMARQAALPRDGSLDNTLIAHEWGHYLQQPPHRQRQRPHRQPGERHGRGLGRLPLAAAAREGRGPQRCPPMPNFSGTYAITPYPVGGPDFRARCAQQRVLLRHPPLSVLARHEQEPADVQAHRRRRAAAGDAADLAARRAAPKLRSAQHRRGVGGMLWECYSNLLNDTGRLTFAQAQDRMKRYLVAGLKMTPTDPDLRGGARRAARRDAGAGRARRATCACTGFAKRGLGVGAVAPDNLSTNNAGVVESYRVTAAAASRRRRSSTTTRASITTSSRSIADEITKLDNGTFMGWARTGESFNVYADVPAAAPPVCRFFSTAFGAKSSHFYAPDRPGVHDGQGKPDLAIRGGRCSRCWRRTPPAIAPAGVAGLSPVQQRPGRRAQPSLHDEPRHARHHARQGLDRGRLGRGVMMCSPLIIRESERQWSAVPLPFSVGFG